MPRLRRIVHIGPGEAPVGMPNLPVAMNEIHLGFETRERLVEAADTIRKEIMLHPLQQRVRIIKRDARHTRLKASSVHEVHMHSVLSQYSLGDARRLELIREALRILRPDGALYVSNHITPENCTAEHLERLVQQAGGTVEFIIPPRERRQPLDTQDVQFVRRFARSALIDTQRPGTGFYLARIRAAESRKTEQPSITTHDQRVPHPARA